MNKNVVISNYDSRTVGEFVFDYSNYQTASMQVFKNTEPSKIIANTLIYNGKDEVYPPEYYEKEFLRHDVQSKHYKDKLRNVLELIGKIKMPLPKELYSEKLLTIQLYLFFISFPLLLAGIILTNNNIITLAASLLFISALLYTINIFKIILHKPHSYENTK